MKNGVWRGWGERLQGAVQVCAIQHVVMRLPLQVLCYSQSVRWWACAYLQLSGFRQRKHRGETRACQAHCAKITPSFQSKREKYLFVLLFVCLLLCPPDWLPDAKTISMSGIIQFNQSPLNYTLSQFTERSEERVWRKVWNGCWCALKSKKGLLFWLSRHIYHICLFTGWRVIMSFRFLAEFDVSCGGPVFVSHTLVFERDKRTATLYQA